MNGLTVEREERSAAEAARGLRDALGRVLETGGGLVERLGYADLSVAFVVQGAEDDSVCLLLDRQPPALAHGEPAAIELTLSPAQADRYAAGELPMPAAIISGRVRARGDARVFLEIDPILQGLLNEHSHRGAASDEAHAPAGPIAPELCAIETRDLYKAFGPNQVLAGLDIRIPEGTISVVLGPSGTGKSVLLQHVIGLMRPDSGETLIRGRPLSKMSRSELLALRREIGVMFQDGALFSAMNVYDNVAFPLRQHTDLKEHEVKEVVEEHLASVGLASAAHRMPNELSGGMRKRAGLARALVLEPGIVLCDEPDSGLDPVRTALLGDLLVAQHAEYGGTMVVVTHNVMLARAISDHVSIVWRGKVLESGLAEDIFESPTPFVQQFLAGAAQGPLGMDA